MFSRFCKLCYNRADISVVNLRRYKISPALLQEHDDKDDNTLPEVEEKLLEKDNKLREKDERRPIIVCRRPQFNFYKGTTYSKFDTIPLASQGWHHYKSKGDYFTIYPMHNETDRVFPEEPSTFHEFGLHPKLIENLEINNIHVPSEIQTIGIPSISRGENTVLSAETGCGKTFAFLLPTLNHILKWKRLELNQQRGPNSPFGLIITPSRELADQIGAAAKKVSKDLDIDIKVITGGKTKRIMRNPSIRNVDLLIGTLGVTSKLVTNRVYKLDYVRLVVLDEAHALFHETFDIKLELFLRKIAFATGHPFEESDFPTGSQLTLVSATKPSELPAYLKQVLDINSLTEAATDNFHRVMVPQKFMRLTAADKPRVLLKLVKPKAAQKHPVIVFSNDSSTCDWISLFFNEFNIKSVNVNGDMAMAIRRGKFASFQRGDFPVLSATNAGARGLDTVTVNNVINYDFPMETADYIHRCGRTGRIGTKGECRVTNFINRPLEIELTKKIERATRRMRALPIFNMVDEHMKRQEEELMDGPKLVKKTSKREKKGTKQARGRRREKIRGSM